MNNGGGVGEGWACDPERLFQEFVEAGEDWSDKEAAAQILDETRKPLLAQLATQSLEKSETAKERTALASLDYHSHVERMVAARREANRARVRYAATQTKIELIRTRETTRRAEIQLTR